MNSERKYAEMELLVPMIEEKVASNKEVRLTVSGNSMFPMLIHRRDSVVLKKIDKLKKYDIPLYRRENGAYVLHRIVKIENNCFHIAGDNEIKLEYPVKNEQTIAVVRGFYRKGKYYSTDNFLYKIYTRLWCALLPCRYRVLSVLIRFKRKMGGKSARKSTKKSAEK